MFPKKGPERKSLMFLSNLLRLDPKRRKEVYKKVLKSKTGKERATLIHARKVASKRKEIFLKFDSLVREFSKRNPRFEGVIVFGGTVKKDTPPTDIDFIFVGTLPEKEKSIFTKELAKSLGIQANPFPVKIELDTNPKRWEDLLSTPYLHGPEEWTPQNFIGNDMFRRRIMRRYKSALKTSDIFRGELK